MEIASLLKTFFRLDFLLNDTRCDRKLKGTDYQLFHLQYQSQCLKEFRTWSRAALVIVFGNVQRIAKKFPKILAADKTTLPYKVKPRAHIKLSSDSRVPTQTLVSKKGVLCKHSLGQSSNRATMYSTCQQS